MSKPVKDMIVRELRSRYGHLDSVLWVELVGVDGRTANQLRGELRRKNLRLEVVKNSLLRRALGDTALAPLARAVEGPTALVSGGQPLPEVARTIEAWLPKVKGLRLRGAVLEGEWIDESRVGQLSSMPTRRDLQAQIASCARAPGANLAAAILAGGGRVAGCLKAMIEKAEKSPAN
jgi:large subunit ribosomal protein L10